MIDKSKKIGMLGEIYAARYLRKKGYEIWAANYGVKTGEIDIAAYDVKNNVLSFVEVKTRSDGAYFDPREAVTREKEETVKNAAAHYMSRYKLKENYRFDIIEVIILGDNKVKIRHNINAF